MNATNATGPIHSSHIAVGSPVRAAVHPTSHTRPILITLIMEWIAITVPDFPGRLAYACPCNTGYQPNVVKRTSNDKATFTTGQGASSSAG